MNGIGRGGFALTPRSRYRTGQEGAVGRRDDDGWQLSLKSVIGTTTSSNNAFDCLPEHHVFAYCAGPAVILSHVDESFNVTQRLFRARPNTAPINASQSFYSPNTPPTTPIRSRHGSPLKESIPGGLGAASGYTTGSPGGVKAATLNREATCISLSRGNRFLAVGEVRELPKGPWPPAYKLRQGMILGFCCSLRHQILPQTYHCRS